MKKEKEKIEAKLIDLKEQLKMIEENDPYKREGYSDENTQDDDAAEREEHTRSEALQKDLSLKIQKLEKALGKIKNNTYGKCEECGGDIDKARLRVLPEAEICMTCARKK